MKCIRVNIQKLEVESFSVRDGAQLKLFFNDGANKCIKYTAKLDSVDQDVGDMLMKITTYEKSQNKVFDAQTAMDGFVSVLIENDEGIKERMKVFLARMREQKRNMKGYGTHVGYIEKMNKLQKQVIEFNKKN